ncbi:MAG: efflux RND transporter periplasmic adaptor subunit [Bacteroidia bacterium]|nr:efflux RND transporter periplasmic adaptor subunit [Bacteroidia bacterium]
MKKYQIITLSLATLAMANSCAPEQKAESTTAIKEKAIPVSVVPVIPYQKGIAIKSSGIVGSKKEVKLSFKIGGVIQEVFVREGSYVKKGQLLARLNSKEIDAQVIQAKAGLEKANRDLQRVDKLYRDTVATLEQVQDLSTAKEVAQANLEIAEFNRKYAEIYAPSSGRILQQFAERGEIVGPGSPVYFLATEDQAKVIRIGLSDKDVVKVVMNDEAMVRFDAYPGENFKARVSEIAAGANPQNGTYEIELSIDSKGFPLKNGFVGKVSLYPEARNNKVQVPLSALVEANQEAALVYALDSTGENVIPLNLKNYELGDSFMVVSGEQLLGKTQIVSDGAKYLNPDSKVKVHKEKVRTLSQK